MASGITRETHDRFGRETGGRERVQALPPSAASRSNQQLPRLALVALLDEIVDQFARGVVHLDVESFDTASKVVEGHNGRDSHEQAECSGDQGFRDAAGNRADARSLLGGDLLEGVQNADDGAEQPDEGSRGTDGGQDAQAPLQLGVNDGFRALESAAGAGDGLVGSSAAGSAELLQTGGHNLGEVGLLVAVGDLNRLFKLAVLQSAGNLGRELARLLAGS